MKQDAGSKRTGLALVCAAAVAGFVAWSWPLAMHLSTHTLVREASLNRSDAAGATTADWDLIVANDQVLSLWGAVDNARAIVRGDLAGLMSQGQCYPMPESTTLGEHMIELGVQASPWWLLSGDPVVAFNLSFLGALVTGAAGMFLFLHRHTASVAAAVVGALAFAFATPRLVDLPYHPAVVGTHWIPWVLWSFDRVMSGQRAAAPAWFAVTLLMSALVGSYPLLAVALVGAVYGLVTVVQDRRRGELRLSALGWCTVAALPAVAIAAAVLLAYVRVQRDWVLMPNDGAKYVVAAADYLPGGLMSVGATSLLGLVALCLQSLLRIGGASSGWSASAGSRAIAALAASALVAFLVATALPLPGGTTWSVYEELAGTFPFLNSVRAPGKVGLAVCFALQALGAIGWSRVFALLASRERVALAAGLVVLIAFEASPPRWAHGAFDLGARMQLREVAPPRVTIDAMATALGKASDRRAVLDLPTGRMIKAPLALLDAAYHGHPTSACYNSLIPPTMRAVQELIARSRVVGGVAELAAAGFGYIIERPPFPSSALSSSSFPPPARLLVFEKEMAVWELPAAENIHSDVSRLALEVTGGATRADTFAPEPPYEIDVLVTNRSDQTWMAPRPLQPLFADIELVSDDGHSVFRSRARGVLPLALAAQGKSAIKLVMPEAPETGAWRATVRVDGGSGLIALPAFLWSNERD